MFRQWKAVMAMSCLMCACRGAINEPPPVASLARDVITAEEIEASQVANAYDAIKKLRANFLNYRGRTSLQGTSSPDPFVYLDDQAYGPISALRSIPANQIETIRLYRVWEAQTKYGQGLMGGVIAVNTRHQ